MKNFYPLLLCCCFSLSNQSAAQTWNGSVSSDWNTAANWTPNSIPGAASTVDIINASAPNQPVLSAPATISNLNLTHGILNLNGNTLTCTNNATLTGDSLYNGKIVAYSFTDITTMHLGGKVIFENTGPGSGFWSGNNKFYGDSLIIISRLRSLHLG